MSVPFRSPDGSLTRPLDQAEIGAYYAAGWRPVDPNQQVTIMRVRRGQPEPFVTSAGQLGDILREGGPNLRPFQSAEEMGMVLEAAEDRRRTEIFRGGEAQAMAAAGNVLDLISFGGFSAAVQAIDPEMAELTRQAQAHNPDTMAATTMAGLLLPMGVGAIGARTGSQALRATRFLGVGGAGEAAGLGVRSLVRRGINAAGLPAESLIARAGPQAAQIIAENAAVAAGLEMTAAIQQNRPLSSEIILADAGIGTAFGLGILGLGAGVRGLGTRFANRVRATNGGRVTGEGLLDAAQRQDQDINMDWWQNTVLSRPADNIAGRTVRLQSLASNAPEDALQVFSHPGVADIAMDQAGLATRAERAFNAVDNIITAEIPVLQEAVQSTRWLGQHADTFASLDGAVVRTAVNREVGAAIGALGSVADDAFATTRGIGRAEQAAARDLIGHLEPLAASGAAAPREILEEILNTKKAIYADVRAGRIADPNNFGSTREAFARLNAASHSESIFGQVGKLQADRDMHFSALIGGEKGLLSGIGRTNRAALVEGNRAISRESILRMIRKEGSELDGATTMSDSMGDFTHNLSVVHRSLTALAELGGVERSAIARMQGKVADATRAVEQGTIYAAANKAFMTIQNAQRRGFGILSGMGIGGGAVGAGVGAVAGGPLGAVVGFGAGAAFSALANPANALARAVTIRRMINNFNTRFDTGLAGVRRMLQTGNPLSVRAARLAARGIQPYYDLESPARREQEFIQMRQDILEVADSPELMMDRLAYTSAGLDDTDPYLADAFNVSAVRGLTYLRLQLPEPLRDPLSGEEYSIPPSVEEVEDFVRKYAVVEDPLVVLDRFARGILQPADVHAMQNVYPELYALTVAEVAAVASEFKADEIAYNSRIQMSILFDIPTDNTMDATFMAAMQNQGFQTAQQANAVQSPRSQITRPTRLSENTFTETQRLMQP